MSLAAVLTEPEMAMPRVLVRGSGALARRVAALLDEFEVTIDEGRSDSDTSSFTTAERFEVVVELSVGDHDTMARRRRSATVAAGRLIGVAASVGATHVVLVSSAMVYGAAPNNPVPLTEEAILRPDPRFIYARQLATAELLVERWRCSAAGRASTVLRPAIPMAADGTSSLARALAAGFGQRFVESRSGSQFVHLDDVATAVALGVRERLDGVYNVAPDGWIPGERLLALTGDGFHVPLPDRVAEVVEALRWRFQRGPIPPGLRSYTQYPWSVANDKLKACGWCPTVTNEQVYVEGTEGRWWTTITPKRRQELALGAVGALVIAAFTAGLSLLAWSRRRASRSR